VSDERGTTIRSLLLTRRGLVFAPESNAEVPGSMIRGVELELAELGYVLSPRLRVRLGRQTTAALNELRRELVGSLAAALGADRKHAPLFRNFPDDVPRDTRALWWVKVLSHYLQAPDQPCLFCGEKSTTHVLSPCEHVVCDRCFDGASYSACPVCERHVDRSSPFFVEAPVRGSAIERVTFRQLDLGADETAETRALFVSLCERKQALSPDDREALTVLLRERGSVVLPWLPAKIPVRENVAIVFGTLFQSCEPDLVLPIARRYMTTATDVLRFIAVLSGTDGSLQAELRVKAIDVVTNARPLFGKLAELLAGRTPRAKTTTAYVSVREKRFKVARLRRPLRRALLSLLEGFDGDRLAEDMFRHRSYWVWVGEFLHPAEYAARYPSVARAFEIVREQAPDGRPAPTFRGWSSRLEQAITAKNFVAMIAILRERPGELARRFDRALRLTGADAGGVEAVVAAFVDNLAAFATPVLLTLRSHLATRSRKAPIRVYWPKGRVAKGVSSPDDRAPLPSSAIERSTAAIDAELLRRFSEKPKFELGILDEGLGEIIVPFNERTASASAVALPRGSRITVPGGKHVRLFLHWCQPEKDGRETDLDLSVGFYSEHWAPVGVCSYYQLRAESVDGRTLATSAGDLRDAPWPDGATELVDVDLDAALASNVRYAVMVVNNYSGMPFGLLERAFAGIMFRDDPHGQHFDPRTVALKFALAGDNGVFLPLVLDVRDNVLHWLDVQSKGQLALNNVASSNQAITKICPELMSYFGSRARPSMFDLAALHAAARCKSIVVRGQATRRYTRRDGEDISAFHARLVRGAPDETDTPVVLGRKPLLAALLKGDVELPEGSAAYALFREKLTPSLAASDLLS
jgi:hypothetical protein